MVADGVAVQLILRRRLALDEASAKALLSNGVGVNNDGVFGCRGPPWRCLLGCFLLGLCLPGEILSPVLRGSDGGGIDVWGVALELMSTCFSCGWWFDGCLKVWGLGWKRA
jgi:hypothetical protein